MASPHCVRWGLGRALAKASRGIRLRRIALDFRDVAIHEALPPVSSPSDLEWLDKQIDAEFAKTRAAKPSWLERTDFNHLDAVLKQQRLKRLAATIAAVVVIVSAFWFADCRQRSYGQDQLARKAHVGATVEGWYYARAPRSGSRPLAALRLKLDDGRSVDAGSTAHDIAANGQHVDVTERHYRSG